MVKTKYKRSPVDYKRKAQKSQTIPDQSMDIHELVRRFVKGIPADVQQRQAVYHSDNNAVDFEKLGRLDPADKAFEASQLRQANEESAREIRQAIDDRRRRSEEEKERDQGERADGTGIDSLDNTMPDDTGADSQSVTRGKKSKNQ